MNKPLCILVDDEAQCLSALKNAIEEIGLLEIERSFLDPDKFLMQVDELKADIVFLDMEMPIYGDEVARKLTDKKIIFVSGYVEQAIKGFEVNAIDFVPKPIRLSRLKTAILKAFSQTTSSEHIIIKSQNSKKEIINVNKIAMVRCGDDSRDKQIILENGKSILAKRINFNTLIEQLPSNFLQINPGELVNLDFVNQLISTDSIGISFNNSHRELVLGDRFKDAFFEAKPYFKD